MGIPSSPATDGRRTLPTGRAPLLDWRKGVLLLSAAVAIVAALTRARFPQPPDYFRFADDRNLAGVPSALNVLSNLAFAVAGLAGVLLLVRGKVAFRDERERAPWVVFFAAVAGTSLGSAWFHLDPSIETLVWDRLPMAVGFMALLCALLTERVDPRARRLLWPLVAAGVASVLFWYRSELAGAGDLRPYLLVQFYPLVAIPIVLVLFPPTCTGSLAYLAALGAYLLAKVAEAHDGAAFELGHLVSGHTVKHLLAAAGIGVIAWMLRHRRVLPAR